jgi:hypothetical protein
MKYNVCLISPPNYIHVLAFWELAELIHFSLIELGHDSSLQFKKMEKDATNIVFGCHLLSTELMPKIPKSTIFINTEQIYLNDNHWNKNIFEWARYFEFWDYSEKNILKFNEIGIPNVKLLKLGFQKELSRIIKSPKPEIDILFYGFLNERRQKILNQLESKGLKVKSVVGLYGVQRDQLIANSKVVLNHHFYTSEIFEIVRVFYLLSNAISVVGEVNTTTSIDETFKNAICAAPYDEIVEACEMLIQNASKREAAAKHGYEVISKLRQSVFTSNLIHS